MKTPDIRWMLIAVGLALPVLGATGEDRTEGPSPAWQRVLAGLGSIGLDGTLRLRYSLGETRELNLLGIHCVLEHRIEEDAFGNARSVWRVRALQSSLAPGARDELLWRRPGGTAVRFSRRRLGRFLVETEGGRSVVRQDGPEVAEVWSPDGVVWRYLNGILVGAELPARGTLRVESRGGVIARIDSDDSRPGEPELLHAEFDALSRLTDLKIGALPAHSFRWNESGQLVGWRRGDGSEFRFEYRDGLLVGIGGPGRSARRFSWKPNAGAARGDSLWPAPVHLATDDANTFSYGLSARGFIIDVHQAAPGGDRRVVFNPVRRRLEYRGSREKLVVTFLPGTAGRSPVGQVEDGCGGLLESYRYGADGRVLAVTRRSEPGFNASAGGPDVEARLEDAGPPETPLP
jgi:YD repeat-containing protein